MPTPAADRAIPAPAIDPTNKPFFDGLREGKLLIGLCKDTGRHFFYPRGSSPFTLSPNIELVEASGRGEVYSFSVMRMGDAFCIAYVELEEGPRIVTNIVDCDLDEVRIGMKVQFVTMPSEDPDQPVAMFRPA